MAAPKKKVNLLVQEGFEFSFLGRIVNWALSAGRVVVVVTELVVILAFISRFWLDRNLTDLNQQNAARKAQVEATFEFESEFRASQARAAAYKTLLASQGSASTLVEELASLVPAEVSLTEIKFSDEEIQISGIALSEGGLAGFIKGLEDSESFESVSVKDVSFGTSAQTINFSLNGDMTKAQGAGGSK